jgi:hypothetical protein
METSHFTCQEEVQETATSRKSNAYRFWDSQRQILEKYVKRGSTVNGAHYCEMRQDKLKPAVCSKR